MGDNPQYRASFERARLLASQFHFQKAKDLGASGNYETSHHRIPDRAQFRSDNQYVSNELQNVRVKYEKEQNKEQLSAIEKAKEDAKKNMRIYQALGLTPKKRSSR